MAVDTNSFEQKLNAFVFFHLGANANCTIEQAASSLKVSLEHPRIEPFSFQIDCNELAEMLKNHQDFEDFMLHQLTRHRRSH